MAKKVKGSGDNSIRFSVGTAELRSAVQLVRNGLGQTKTDLSVMLVLIQVDENGLTMFATDKELFVRVTIPVLDFEGNQPVSVCILGQKIVTLCNHIASEVVFFSPTQDSLEVRAGYLTLFLDSYDKNNVVALKTVADDEPEQVQEWVSVLSDAILESLQVARTCAAISSPRPEITHTEFKTRQVFSSDGRKVMMVNHTELSGLALKVPNTSLNSLVGVLKGLPPDSVLETGRGKSFYVLRTDTVLFGVRLVDRNFPSFQFDLESPDDIITVDKKVLEEQIAGVSLGLAQDEVRVLLTFMNGADGSGILEVSAIAASGRKSFERVPCGRKSKDTIEFPVSTRHLRSTLAVFSGDSVVDLKVFLPLSILAVVDKNQTREIITLIPARTKDVEQKERAEKKAGKEVASPTSSRQADQVSLDQASLDSDLASLQEVLIEESEGDMGEDDVTAILE